VLLPLHSVGFQVKYYFLSFSSSFLMLVANSLFLAGTQGNNIPEIRRTNLGNVVLLLKSKKL
jgi:hypothetical protein